MKNYVEQKQNEMIDDLASLVKFKSVFSQDEKPFGLENRKVLDKCLELMQKYGLSTTNLDYYCGYGEVGSGKHTIGILGHLDVVPVADGWNTDPFNLAIKDGNLYGRGVSDDKGAVVASMYALRYLIETNYQFKNKVRLIVGCNEETGSKCIKHYVEKCGHVDAGFTPDGNFPGIYAEKGMIHGFIKCNNSKIISIKGGSASNIVCKDVECLIKENEIDLLKFEQYLNMNSIEFETSKQDDNLLIKVYGKAAHASLPHLGVNAIQYLFEALYYANFKDSLVDFYHKYFKLEYNGQTIGFESLKDEETNTSLCFGNICKVNDEIKISLDIRFPVKTNTESCMNLLKQLNNENITVVVEVKLEPLYFDRNSKMLKALDKAYRDVTQDYTSKMEAIGGGTYAKNIKNIIAFGCEFIGEENRIHDANEMLSIESFKKQVLIYIEAIKNLDNMYE